MNVETSHAVSQTPLNRRSEGKVAVIGSRAFSDYDLLQQVLDEECVELLISGGAKGADTLASEWADSRQVETVIFKPQYDRYGRGATHVRNREIVMVADKIIAFWDGRSRGTASTIAYAKKQGKAVHVINY